eukprot:2377765-Pleurochrysis_carterae.AAC.1
MSHDCRHDTCAVLLAEAQKFMEDREMTINAPAQSKSGKRTSKLGYEDHLGTKIVSVFDVAQLLGLVLM